MTFYVTLTSKQVLVAIALLVAQHPNVGFSVEPLPGNRYDVHVEPKHAQALMDCATEARR
jgi:hypothetical protein